MNNNNHTGDGVGLHTENNLIYNNTYNKGLFTLLSKFPLVQGEFKNDDIHIIKSSLDHEVSFRVYCQEFCFDSYKKEELKHPLGVISQYHFFSEWDGFKKIKAYEALELIKTFV